MGVQSRNLKKNRSLMRHIRDNITIIPLYKRFIHYCLCNMFEKHLDLFVCLFVYLFVCYSLFTVLDHLGKDSFLEQMKKNRSFAELCY